VSEREPFCMEATEWVDRDGAVWPINRMLSGAERGRFWACARGSDLDAAQIAVLAGVDLVPPAGWDPHFCWTSRRNGRTYYRRCRPDEPPCARCAASRAAGATRGEG
jgi:hypothetical protein